VQSNFVHMGKIKRHLATYLKKDLAKKMILLAGPRQCGKSTLAKEITKSEHGTYLNWDIVSDRLLIQKHEFDFNSKLFVFDELHIPSPSTSNHIF